MGDNRLDTVPFVRYIVPAAAGIICASLSGIGWGYFALTFSIAWISAWFYRNDTVAGGYAWAAVLFFFAAVTAITARTGAHEIGSSGALTAEIVITEDPASSGRWTRCDGYVTAFRKGEGTATPAEWCVGGFAIQLYADSTLSVRSGERIVATGIFYPFDADNGSYERLMIRRGIAGRIFIGSAGILAVGGGNRQNIADRLRSCASNKFSALSSYGMTGVAAAMVTGDKRQIPREIRQTYGNGGGAHLLAVSGLHVGIVFLLVNLILYWIPSVRRGHILKNFLAVGAVWLFAASAGLSPSVIRASLMFSFTQLALARGTATSAVNLLAASAFVMLAVEPNYAADPGFVLSYSAVLSIILFFGPVFSLVRSGNRLLDGIVSVYIVGLAASLAAAPFVSYWFGAVPVAGIIVNPLVIFTAHVIVAVGVVWLIWPFGLGGGTFAAVIGRAEDVQNRLMEWCAGMEWGLVDVKLSLLSAVSAYLLVILSALLLRRYAGMRNKTHSLPL